MNRFSQVTLSVFFVISVLGCSKDEPKTIEATISTRVAFDDKNFGAPEGKVILFDITESELKSNYLSEAGGMFALTRKDGKPEFPYKTSKFAQRENAISVGFVFTSYIDDGYSHLPKKMLLYVYIEKPTSDHKDMYSFTEVNVGEKDFDLSKSFPAIIRPVAEFGNEYIKW